MYYDLAPGGGCDVLFSPRPSVRPFDFYGLKAKVIGTVHCFLKVQSYHKNWAIEKFQICFIDTS